VEILVWLLIMGAALTVLGFRWTLKQRRRSELHALAMVNGLVFASTDHGLLEIPFRLFERGDGRGAENVLGGEWKGQPLRAFDYWYYEESNTSRGGRQRRYRHFSCALLEIPAYLPHLDVTREGPLTRISDHVGLRDLEFESEEFNRKFQIWSPIRSFAYEFLDGRMIRWLLSLKANYCFETFGSHILFYCARVRPQGFIPLMWAAATLPKRIPRVVWNLYGTGAEETPADRGETRSLAGPGPLPIRWPDAEGGVMDVVLIVILGLVLLLLLVGVASYNRFVTQRNLIRDAFANIDTELRRRYDLIPNLVETVRGYAAHERETFEEVTRARAAAVAATGSPAAQAAAEGPLVAALRQLLAVAENYPDLKANQNFLQLQAELANTEDRIQTSRRFYNANVREYNRRIQSVPSNIIASMFGFKEEEFFEIEPAMRATVEEAPRVDFGPGAAAPPAQPPSAPAPQEPTPPASPSG
jgi:LemA protein